MSGLGTEVACYRIALVKHSVSARDQAPARRLSPADELVPVMMQQAYGVGQCTAWPWPSATSS